MIWNRNTLRIAIVVAATTAAGCDWAVVDGVEGGPDGGSAACGQGGAAQVPGGGEGGAVLVSGGAGGAVQASGGGLSGCGGAGGAGGQGGYDAE